MKQARPEAAQNAHTPGQTALPAGGPAAPAPLAAAAGPPRPAPGATSLYYYYIKRIKKYYYDIIEIQLYNCSMKRETNRINMVLKVIFD